MGKRNKTGFNLRTLVFSKHSLAIAGVVPREFSPVTTRRRKRKFIPSPQLEKIGGMDADVKKFITRHVDISASTTHILHTSFSESIENLHEHYSAIVNLKRVNDLKEINKFFSSVNGKLPKDGIFISCVETKMLRRERLYKKYPPVLNRIYYFMDFILKRVFPKLPVTRNIYMWLTGGRNRVLSRTETLGRLYAAGFEIIDKKLIGNNLYFAVKKTKHSLFDYEPIYGPVFKMRRQGKNGSTIYVYKMRTMHAYSEFIQHYVYEKNKLDEGGKMKDDFRVSTIGRFFRRYWIDELPMIVNLLKGELKLVGVRPLSSHYLGLYSKELRERRATTKPGLIPPFYVDMPKTLDEIMASEMRYLEEYKKHPFLTDTKYFFLSLRNILFRRARSK